jgi:hypothetical protein
MQDKKMQDENAGQTNMTLKQYDTIADAAGATRFRVTFAACRRNDFLRA